LNKVLAPLAEAGVDLQVVMGYHYHGAATKAAIEVAPVTGKKAIAAARKAGLAPSTIPTLLVEGENKVGLGAAITQAIAEAGINLHFLVGQVIGAKFSAVIGFPDDAASRKAATLIKKAIRQLEK
jgi:predicted amino acid-binding ACT domain protein